MSLKFPKPQNSEVKNRKTAPQIHNQHSLCASSQTATSPGVGWGYSVRFLCYIGYFFWGFLSLGYYVGFLVFEWLPGFLYCKIAP